MSFSDNECADFEMIANPHEWFLVASDLHEQAVALRGQADRGIMEKIDIIADTYEKWPANNRSTILLCGFAIENLIKAYLVYENPLWISGGKLGGKLKTHILSDLAKMSNMLPLCDDHMQVIRFYQDGLESWARYPSGINIKMSKPQLVLEGEMWGPYLSMMKDFEKKIIEMLSEVWTGPHQFKGSYRIKGSWFCGSGKNGPTSQFSRDAASRRP